MICVVIKGPSVEEMRQQVSQVAGQGDLIELRLDYIQNWTLKDLENLQKEFSFPMIFTLRSQAHGGAFLGSEKERLQIIKNIAQLQPEYIDIESTVSPNFAQELKQAHPNSQILVSFHDFEKMPSLSAVYDQMKKVPGDLYKIAVMIHSSSEALATLQFMKNTKDVVAMGMGKFGELTRILGPVYGARFVYAAINQGLSTAPGQVTVNELVNTYHYKELTPAHSVYGLIGDPIDKSLGHLVHNAVFHEEKYPAIYVKFPVNVESLPSFLKEAKEGNVRGLSVTMPLKEEIIPYLDFIDPWAEKVGAVNTLVFEKGQIKGCNTDGKGALDAIEDKIKVKGKKIVFIGAGGAIKSMAAEAMERGAQITILNRDPERAIKLGHQLQCHAGGLELLEQEYESGYDVLVNGTPSPMPIDPKWILPDIVAMDITAVPKLSPFLEKASEKGARLVYGYEMFVNQAINQYEWWLGNKLDPKKIKEIIGRIVRANI